MYTKSAERFCVNAPKRSHTSLKKILKYISCYMKRGPIASDLIFVYHGTMVMFEYLNIMIKRRRQTR
ncbi:transposase [Enterococcus faecalis]